MAKVMVVDDESSQRAIVASILRGERHELAEADGVEKALQVLDSFHPAVLLTDLKMGEKSGLELVEAARRLPDPPEVVVVTAFGSVETSVRAMRMGAYDYLMKPLERDELILVVDRAAEKFTLRTDQIRLRSELGQRFSGAPVARSQAMQDILTIVKKVAPDDATVLLRGESGTGKERIARLIHDLSPRGRRPMLCINCAAFPEALLESELFGYEKGAFTGAESSKVGIFEAASGTTLFLDEIGDMAVNTQAKVLRALQEKEIRRLGATANIRVDIRFIAATNKNIEEAIKSGAFREDLFYRLNVIPLEIPPLRARPEDIPPLVELFSSRRRGAKPVSPEALKCLCQYAWPGNVRELEAVMERILLLSSGHQITPDDLPPEIRFLRTAGGAGVGLLPESGLVFEEWEKNLLQQALTRSKGVAAEAAKLLGMTYRTFLYRAKKFGFLNME